MLDALFARIRATFTTTEAQVNWLLTPNRALGHQVPLFLVMAGRAEEVDRALEALDSGVFV